VVKERLEEMVSQRGGSGGSKPLCQKGTNKKEVSGRHLKSPVKKGELLKHFPLGEKTGALVCMYWVVWTQRCCPEVREKCKSKSN